MSVKRWKLGWKRCDCVKCEAALTIEQTEENCGWVMWEHHKEEVASLKAEVERLTALVESNLNSSKVAMGKADAMLHERDSLKAEVERLRKAGDKLAGVIGLPVNDVQTNALVEAWNAAKEGKPSV